jgi:hypothetical protein
MRSPSCTERSRSSLHFRRTSPSANRFTVSSTALGWRNASSPTGRPQTRVVLPVLASTWARKPDTTCSSLNERSFTATRAVESHAPSPIPATASPAIATAHRSAGR